MSEDVTFKLDDSVIKHIVKLIQIGLIQGIDVTDYFRMVELQQFDNKLFLGGQYLERHVKEIESLLENIPTQVTDQEQ